MRSLLDATTVLERVSWARAEDDGPDKWAVSGGGHVGLQKFVVPLARAVAGMFVWSQA